MDVSTSHVNVNAALIAQFNRTTIRGQKEEDGKKSGVLVSSDTVEIGALLDITFDQGSKITVDQVIARLQEAFQLKGVKVDLKEAIDSGLDTSPEATADRIFKFATSFFDVFVQKHAGEEEETETAEEAAGAQDEAETKGAEGKGSKEDVVDRFVGLVRDAIKKGFEDAKKILAGIPTMNDDIMKQINRTFDLVMEKLDKFLEEKKAERLQGDKVPEEQLVVQENAA